MAGNDSFNSWLEEFNRDIDKPQPPRPEEFSAQGARQGFDNWWQATQEPFTSARENLTAPRFDVKSESEAVVRFERLAEERAELKMKLDALTRENLQLRERQAGIETQIAEFETRLSVARKYEAENRGLEMKVAALESARAQLEAQVARLREEKAAQTGALEELRRQADSYQKLIADKMT